MFELLLLLMISFSGFGIWVVIQRVLKVRKGEERLIPLGQKPIKNKKKGVKQKKKGKAKKRR